MASLTKTDPLAPLDYDEANMETVASYVKRVRPLVPNMPECVLEQWLHRHWSCVSGTWSWVGLPALRFVRDLWSTDEIRNQVKSSNEEAVEGWSQQFRSNELFRRSHVGKFMLQHGTWEVPIIVVRNDRGLKMPNGLPLGEPYSLLEGHHRLAYFRAMYEDRYPTLKHEHAVWVATVDPSEVSSKW